MYKLLFVNLRLFIEIVIIIDIDYIYFLISKI